jgi:hypothetical protein
MEITDIIQQQEEIVKAMDILLEKDNRNPFLCAAVIRQISSKHNLMAYSLGLDPKETVNREEVRKEYMRKYMRVYQPKYRKRKKGEKNDTR